VHFIPDQTQTRPSGPSPLDFTDNNLLSAKKWKFIKYGHKMLELRTKCMRFKNINSCNNTQSNISERLKAVGWRKKRQRWNLDLAKRVVNLSFSSWLSPMTKLVLCFPYFANIYIIYDQHIYNQWCCNWLQPLRSSAKSQECSIQISHWLGIKTDSQMLHGE